MLIRIFRSSSNHLVRRSKRIKKKTRYETHFTLTSWSVGNIRHNRRRKGYRIYRDEEGGYSIWPRLNGGLSAPPRLRANMLFRACSRESIAKCMRSRPERFKRRKKWQNNYQFRKPTVRMKNCSRIR